jgi:hypothetical protein
LASGRALTTGAAFKGGKAVIPELMQEKEEEPSRNADEIMAPNFLRSSTLSTFEAKN